LCKCGQCVRDRTDRILDLVPQLFKHLLEWVSSHFKCCGNILLIDLLMVFETKGSATPVPGK